MARKRLGRRERLEAKAIAIRNDAVTRHNERNMDSLREELRADLSARKTRAFDAKSCLSRSHVNFREIWNVKGSEKRETLPGLFATVREERPKLVKVSYLNRKPVKCPTRMLTK